MAKIKHSRSSHYTAGYSKYIPRPAQERERAKQLIRWNAKELASQKRIKAILAEGDANAEINSSNNS